MITALLVVAFLRPATFLKFELRQVNTPSFSPKVRTPRFADISLSGRGDIVFRVGDVRDYIGMESGGRFRRLDTGPYKFANPHAINGYGVVVGEAVDAKNGCHLIRIANGRCTSLVNLGDGYFHSASINDSGIIVGTFRYGTERAFIFKNGRFISKTPLGKGDVGLTDIANDGTMLGWRQLGDEIGLPQPRKRCYLIKGGRLREVYQGSGASAIAMNSRGDVICKSYADNEIHEGFFCRGGKITSLGICSPVAIDRNGVVLCDPEQYDNDGSRPAFLWDQGRTFNLKTLIEGHPGWLLHHVADMNEAGKIVGTGTYKGQPAIFELTPVGSASD